MTTKWLRKKRSLQWYWKEKSLLNKNLKAISCNENSSYEDVICAERAVYALEHTLEHKYDAIEDAKKENRLKANLQKSKCGIRRRHKTNLSRQYVRRNYGSGRTQLYMERGGVPVSPGEQYTTMHQAEDLRPGLLAAFGLYLKSDEQRLWNRCTKRSIIKICTKNGRFPHNYRRFDVPGYEDFFPQYYPEWYVPLGWKRYHPH